MQEPVGSERSLADHATPSGARHQTPTPTVGHARGGILRALATRPPATPGGSATCRNCGAPLDVPPGATLALCVYCHAENAVEIRTRLLSGAKRALSRVTSGTREAQEHDRADRRETRRLLWHELLRYGWRTFLFTELPMVWAIDDARSQASGRTPVIGPIGVVGLLFYFMLKSPPKPADDPAHRRDVSGVPPWVGVVGPIGFWVLLFVIGKLL